MDVRNCRSCGKLFNYIGGPPICAACSKKLDEKFSVVKAYIYDNPGAGIQEVAEDNEVSVAQIKKWVREERLSFSDDSPVGLECENCGKIIKTGRFCPQCKDKMANHLGNIYKEPEPEPVKAKRKVSDPKMRFLDNQ